MKAAASYRWPDFIQDEDCQRATCAILASRPCSCELEPDIHLRSRAVSRHRRLSLDSPAGSETIICEASGTNVPSPSR